MPYHFFQASYELCKLCQTEVRTAMKGKRVLAALTVRLDSGRVLEPSTRAGAEEAFAPHPLTTVINNEVRVGAKT